MIARLFTRRGFKRTAVLFAGIVRVEIKLIAEQTDAACCAGERDWRARGREEVQVERCVARQFVQVRSLDRWVCSEFRLQFSDLRPALKPHSAVLLCRRLCVCAAVGAVDLNNIDWSADAIKGIERSEKGSEVSSAAIRTSALRHAVAS